MSQEVGFLDWLKKYGAFAFCVALFIGGMSFEARHQAPVISMLQMEEQKARDEASKYKEELRIVKTEYQLYRGQSLDGSQENEIEIIQNRKDNEVKSGSIPEKSSQYKVQMGEQLGDVEIGNTVSLFEGNVRISLIGISFEGDPLRHKVTAVVEALGQSKGIEKADVGQAVVIKDQEITYEVKVNSVETFSAQFLGSAKTL